MSGHTPAPWHLNITDEAVYVCAWPDETGESVLARLPRDPEEELDFGAAYHCEEAVENARLIAAAPKLLKACRKVLSYYSPPTASNVAQSALVAAEAIRDLAAAIAEAEGGEG